MILQTAWRRFTVARRPRARYKNLIELIQRRLQLAPDDVRLRTSLATHLGQAGRYREAIAEAERLLELDPTNVGIKRLLLGLKLNRLLRGGESKR
jgi:tetratricopeptide (TPR) repeat protein